MPRKHAILITAALAGAALGTVKAEDKMTITTERQTHPYVGMWVTDDNRV
jgi:hypothetical protein